MARVDRLSEHFDPAALILEDQKSVLVTYGVAAGGLRRLRTYLSELNKCGLMIVGNFEHEEAYEFLVFDEMLVCTYRGFKEALEELGTSLGYDTEIEEWNKLWAFESLADWVTLDGNTRRKAKKAIDYIKVRLLSDKVVRILGPDADDVLADLTYYIDSFEAQHAIAFIAKGELSVKDIYMLKDLLAKHDFNLKLIGDGRWVLERKSRKITLIDAVETIFAPKHYFKVTIDKLAKFLGFPPHKVHSHLRGYSIKDEEYVKGLMQIARSCPTA